LDEQVFKDTGKFAAKDVDNDLGRVMRPHHFLGAQTPIIRSILSFAIC
jgi:hypothetical protein